MNSRAMLATRSLLFSAGMIAATLLWAPVVLMTYPLPFRTRYRVATRWGWFVLGWLRLTCGIRCEVAGREQIPHGPAVILCKHQSTWETIFLQRVFPPQVWVLKRELLRLPFFGWALAMLDPIAIDRGAARAAIKQLLRQGKEQIERGRWVVIFPEGTRTRPGERGRYGPGGAMLAIQSGVPVVPVAHNAGQYWPRRGFLKHPGTIRLAIGPPIDTTGASAHHVMAQVEAWIEGKMAEIGPPPPGASSPRDGTRPA